MDSILEQQQAQAPVAEDDGIPDLSLPPPIIPTRRYGHNFLEETKAFIQINFDLPENSTPPPSATNSRPTSAISFYRPGRYSAARLTLSSRRANLIPRNINLPLDASDEANIVSFQISQPETFSLEFEIFPTFGSQIIAKTVALPSVFVQHARDRLVGRMGLCVLPLFDPRLRPIGEIRFRIMVIQPFHGTPLEITHFAPYWKALSSAAPERGQRDIQDNHNGCDTPSVVPMGGPVTGSSLSGDYVQVFVQLTRDGVPVLYPRFSVRYHGIKIPIARLTFIEFRDIIPSACEDIDDIARASGSRPLNHLATEERLAVVRAISHVDLRRAHRLLASCYLSLREVLESLSTSINVNLCLLYPPTPSMSTSANIFTTTHNNSSLKEDDSTTDINIFTDAVLTTVFDHARALKAAQPDVTRSIVFSCSAPDVCIAVNWKQPNCRYQCPISLEVVSFCFSPATNYSWLFSDPVLLCNDIGQIRDMSPNAVVRPIVQSSGRASMSLKESVRIAQSNNLMGLVLRSSLLVCHSQSFFFLLLCS